MSIPFPPAYELRTNLPKEALGLISDIVETYQNNRPCKLVIEESFDFKRAIYITTETLNVRFDLMAEAVTDYSGQIANWVSYLTRNSYADYSIVDDGYIFLKSFNGNFPDKRLQKFMEVLKGADKGALNEILRNI